MATEERVRPDRIYLDRRWSIGIYTGASLFHLTAAQGNVNPVITNESITDVPADFVADPFMVQRHGIWNMFFEVLNQQTGKGQIGLAISSDGLNWTYQQTVLREPFHLSYPSIFEWKRDYYMIPETLETKTVRLYKAEEFPIRWSLVSELFEGSCADPSIFHFDKRWWMFACSTPYQHKTLRLFFADELTGPWVEHPSSPIVENDEAKARPAGRVLVLDGEIIRFAQDCTPEYGTRVRAFEISELTTKTYVEKEHANSPVLSPNGDGGWNGRRMHHIDAHRLAEGGWIACVDGHGYWEQN